MARKVALLPPLELGLALPASIIRSDETVVILATENGHLGGTWWRTTHGSWLWVITPAMENGYL